MENSKNPRVRRIISETRLLKSSDIKTSSFVDSESEDLYDPHESVNEEAIAEYDSQGYTPEIIDEMMGNPNSSHSF